MRSPLKVVAAILQTTARHVTADDVRLFVDYCVWLKKLIPS